MTPFVCRTLEEHQTRTAEVQRERKACQRVREYFNHLTDDKWNRTIEELFPLPVLAPQGVRGKSGRTYRIVLCSAPGGCSIVQSYNTDNTAPNNHVAVGDERAAALALLGAEGLVGMLTLLERPEYVLRELVRYAEMDERYALCAEATRYIDQWAGLRAASPDGERDG